MVAQFYNSTITEPVVAGDYFSVGWDIQMKDQQRQTISKICL